MPSLRATAIAACLFGSATWIPLACSDEPASTSAGSGGFGGEWTTSSGLGGNTAASGGGQTSSTNGGMGGETPDASPDGSMPDVLCPTTFRFRPGNGQSNPRVSGEWNGFAIAQATSLQGPNAEGWYEGTVDLPPGLHAYKIVYDESGGQQWVLDPDQGRRKYVGGTENSAVKVRDCSLPTFVVESTNVERPSPGQGSFAASLGYEDGVAHSGPDAPGFEASLEAEDVTTPLSPAELTVDATTGHVNVAVAGLADGKYTIRLRAKSKNGLVGEATRLVFWVEERPFSWNDALVYMVVVDRFKDGDPSNNPPATPNADPRGDWKGGDLEGLRQEIAKGTLDALGVRALWLTPFNTNPDGAYLAEDGVHQVAGYHGYWPTKAREVDPRIGGASALHALVKEAHKHGIRILQDFVINHVHQDHEYVAAHPDWFRTGCVCGTNGCDWTAHALDCMFSTYMPDINHSVPEANAAFVDDAVFWLDSFNVDGFRVDAVKHVEEVATRNLAAAVREEFELAKTRYFLMGETAMGWSDCPDPCNAENYDTISKYIGPHGLDGQFDFVLYHGVSYRTFAYGDKGMLHAAYWFEHGLEKWPAGAIMTPYIGSHDTSRFVTVADYRGQDGPHDRGIPGNQWNNTAVAPTDSAPFARARIAFAWLLNLPGAPLLYYGDEYGQWGGADPNNRLMWRDSANLSADEKTTLDLVRKLGQTRQKVEALRRGSYVPLAATEDTLVFGRLVAPGNAAIVALTRATAEVSQTVEVANKLGFGPGTVLVDAISGANAIVGAAGDVALKIPAEGVLVLAPR